MAGIKEFDADEVLDDDSAEGSDPDAMPDDEVDGSSLILSNAAGVGKEAKVAQIIRDLVRKEVAEILRQKTIDLEYEGNEAWVAAEGNNNLSSARGSFGADELNALSDWAVSYTIPSGTEMTGEVVVRLEKGANPNDYRIMSSEDPVNVGDISPVGFVNSPTYDYYLITLAFVGGYAVGETIALEYHGEEGHSLFHGRAPEIESRIDDVVDDVAGKQDIRPVEVDVDHHYWVRDSTAETVFFLEMRNMIPSRLPDVDRVSVLINGVFVEVSLLTPADGDESRHIEVNATEVGNVNTSIQASDVSVDFTVRFQNGNTVVHTETIPIAVVDEVPELADVATLRQQIADKADESDLNALETEVDGKQDARPFDALFEPNYYVKTNSEAITYHLYLHNIDSALLPNVNTFVARIKGQIVHYETFNPATDTEQIVPLELSTVEVGNIRNNLGSDETIVVGLEFRHDSTVVFSERLIITVVEEPPYLTEAPEGDALPVFAEIPIVANQALANRASAATQLNLGTILNALNNAGDIEVSGGNSISLGKGGYEISVSLIVNDRSGTSDARTTFMAALYDSSGNELQKIEPLVGYNRNISTNMTRMNHIGKFLVNMVADGEISVRAKVYQVGDNANPAHTTQVGAVVRIFRLGGPRGEKGDTGGINQSQAQAIADARIANYGIPFTDALAARLLTPFPATGSRDKKIQKFNGDALGWVADEDSGFEVRVVQAWSLSGDADHQELPTDFRDFDYVNFVMSYASLKRVSYLIPISALGNSSYLAPNDGWGWTHSNRNITRQDTTDVFHYTALIKF